MERGQLLPATRALFESCKLPLKEIADGADVGLEWLKKFSQRAKHDYGVNRVQRLHDYLLSIQHNKPRGKSEARPNT